MLAHYSYKFLRLASLLALLLPSAPAVADDRFIVEGVIVDGTGADTADARIKALAQGEKEAFRQIVERFEPGHAQEIIAKTQPADISAAVRGYEVLEEKMSAEKYHAVLRYHFSPERLLPVLPNASQAASPEALAARSNALPAEVAGRKAVLVVPVLNENRTLKLWQDDNKWRNIWYEAALEAGGGLVVVPLGDLDDRVDIDDATAPDATAESLRRLFSRYGVGEIHIMTAYYNLRADPKPALEVTTRRLAPGINETGKSSYTIRSTETLDLLMARASGELSKSIYQQQTIDRTKIEFERVKEIAARVNAGDIRDWVMLRKHLLTQGNIVGVRLTSITNQQTSMIISFKGTADMLGKTLVASGLRVMQDGDSLVLALK